MSAILLLCGTVFVCVIFLFVCLDLQCVQLLQLAGAALKAQFVMSPLCLATGTRPD